MEIVAADGILEAAFAARGFNPHVSVEVDVVVSDPEAPRNCGRWTLTVAHGRGTARAGCMCPWEPT